MSTFIDPQTSYSQASFSSAVTLNKGKNDTPENLQKVCREFEAILIKSIYKGMRTSIESGDLLEKDKGSEIFEDMMDMEAARQTALRNELGIAEILYRQLAPEVPSEE